MSLLQGPRGRRSLMSEVSLYACTQVDETRIPEKLDLPPFSSTLLPLVIVGKHDFAVPALPTPRTLPALPTARPTALPSRLPLPFRLFWAESENQRECISRATSFRSLRFFELPT